MVSGGWVGNEAAFAPLECRMRAGRAVEGQGRLPRGEGEQAAVEAALPGTGSWTLLLPRNGTVASADSS